MTYITYFVPKGSPIVLFGDIYFWLTDIKFFVRASSRQSILILRGERAPLSWPFFSENVVKLGFLKWFGRAQKINFVDLKKSTKFS